MSNAGKKNWRVCWVSRDKVRFEADGSWQDYAETHDYFQEYDTALAHAKDRLPNDFFGQVEITELECVINDEHGFRQECWEPVKRWQYTGKWKAEDELIEVDVYR